MGPLFCTVSTGASCGRARRLHFPKKRPTFSISTRWPSAGKTCGSPVHREASCGIRPTAAAIGTPANGPASTDRAAVLRFGKNRLGRRRLWKHSPHRRRRQAWRTQHGGERRAALLSLEPRGGEISFGLLARQSAELGYRSVVVLPFRSGEEGAAMPRAEFDLRLHDAVTSAGGSQGSIGWRLPLDVPGLDRDTDKLIAEWMRRTEGRLRETFFGNLVCQIPHVASLGHHRR